MIYEPWRLPETAHQLSDHVASMRERKVAPSPQRAPGRQCVIRAHRPDGAIDIAAIEDAERAARRRKEREDVYRRTWRGRFQALRRMLAREAVREIERETARG